MVWTAGRPWTQRREGGHYLERRRLLLLTVLMPILLKGAECSTCEGSSGDADVEIPPPCYSLSQWRRDSFLSTAGVAVATCDAVSLCDASLHDNGSTLQTPAKTPELQRPRCEEGLGCDIPLHCFDFRSLSLEEGSVVLDPPRAVEVTSYQLEGILENPTISNCCALVMFYAPWCEFSAQFARKFNALGRTFDGLPVLALDLEKNDPHKYILAYLPLVAFYYRGRLLMRFNKLSASYEDLRDQIANMTGFVHRDIDVMEEENEGPVPTVRVDSDRYLLHMATLWLIFVVLVCLLRTRLLAGCLEHFGSRIGRRPFLRQDHDQ